MQNVIQQKIKEPIADFLLSKNFKDKTSIKIYVTNNELMFDFKKNKKKEKII